MDNRFVYICECPRVSGDAIKSIKRNLAKQSKFNRSIAIFALTMVAYAAITELNNLELNNKVERLSNDIEELKRKKGE